MRIIRIKQIVSHMSWYSSYRIIWTHRTFCHRRSCTFLWIFLLFTWLFYDNRKLVLLFFLTLRLRYWFRLLTAYITRSPLSCHNLDFALPSDRWLCHDALFNGYFIYNPIVTITIVNCMPFFCTWCSQITFCAYPMLASCNPLFLRTFPRYLMLLERFRVKLRNLVE